MLVKVIDLLANDEKASQSYTIASQSPQKASQTKLKARQSSTIASQRYEEASQLKLKASQSLQKLANLKKIKN